jgi:hypothetical protein
MTITHWPTGKRCTIVESQAERSLCNFGSDANPSTLWIDDTELIIDPEQTPIEPRGKTQPAA